MNGNWMSVQRQTQVVSVTVPLFMPVPVGNALTLKSDFHSELGPSQLGDS